LDTEKSREQIELLLAVNEVFKRYELEFVAEHAVRAANLLGRPECAVFIEEANAYLVGLADLLLLQHVFRLGRVFGSYVVIVDLFKGFFPEAHKLADEIEIMATTHGAIQSGSEEGQTEIKIWAHWA
jgi:hypothetical protein